MQAMLYKQTTMCWLLILIIGTALGYDFRCPVQAEWKLKANFTCLTEDKYLCLFNLLDKKYQEGCFRPDQSSTGTKLVFQPSFNLAECDIRRYQPFLFTTHGNSECVFSKSKCNGEGQTVYNNGLLTNDIACGCDYSHGYAFVSKPKNSCFCIPSEEDCTCFRVECKTLSADYKCITEQDKITTTKCQETYPFISFNQHKRTDQLINNYIIKGYSNAQTVTCYISYILAVCVVIAVLTVSYIGYFSRKKLVKFVMDGNWNSKHLKDIPGIGEVYAARMKTSLKGYCSVPQLDDMYLYWWRKGVPHYFFDLLHWATGADNNNGHMHIQRAFQAFRQKHLLSLPPIVPLCTYKHHDLLEIELELEDISM